MEMISFDIPPFSIFLIRIATNTAYSPILLAVVPDDSAGDIDSPSLSRSLFSLLRFSSCYQECHGIKKMTRFYEVFVLICLKYHRFYGATRYFGFLFFFY